ncbi:MAG: hypothetical protein AB7F59_07600 [Bdellovibrionales bacterium]
MKFQTHPSWFQILRSLRADPHSKNQFAWNLANYQAHLISRSTLSFGLLSRWFQKTYKQNPTWYFPEYICNTPIAKLQSQGDEIIFYPLHEDLTPDLSSLNPKKKGFFVQVQYFGIEKDLTKTAEFCQKNDLHLVEDAAHLLRKTKEPVADFILFSPYKTLGLPTGAVLLGQKRHGSLFPFFKTSQASLKTDALWTAKRLIEDLTPTRVLNFQKKQKMPSDPYVLSEESVPGDEEALTPLSAQLLSVSKNYIESEAKARKQNAQKWAKELHQRTLLSPAWDLQNVDAPYLFPVKFKSKEEARSYFKDWNQKRWLLLTWPDLPKEVMGSTEYPMANRLKETVLFLPTHSSLSDSSFQL